MYASCNWKDKITNRQTNKNIHKLKGCDSNFEVNIFHILKVATNETSTSH